jgi:Cu-Zn family superoxide dismutase
LRGSQSAALSVNFGNIRKGGSTSRPSCTHTSQERLAMIVRQCSVLTLLVAVSMTACRLASSRTSVIRSATAEMRSASGLRYGVLTLSRSPAGVRIDGALTGVPAGVHGIHLHEVGRCDPPEFATAGAHLNPAGAEHGFQNPRGPHAGDLPNVTANSAGQMVVDIATIRVTLDADPRVGLFDIDGTALVIHANRDDQRTDPAGNSGARIACGVVMAG